MKVLPTTKLKRKMSRSSAKCADDFPSAVAKRRRSSAEGKSRRKKGSKHDKEEEDERLYGEYADCYEIDERTTQEIIAEEEEGNDEDPAGEPNSLEMKDEGPAFSFSEKEQPCYRIRDVVVDVGDGKDVMVDPIDLDKIFEEVKQKKEERRRRGRQQQENGVDQSLPPPPRTPPLSSPPRPVDIKVELAAGVLRSRQEQQQQEEHHPWANGQSERVGTTGN